MSQSFVELAPDSTGKKIQMFENVVGSDTVEAMAVSPIDSTGWTDSFVTVADGTGKKVQYFENTIGGNTVLAQALVLVDTTGTVI